jgi:GxxExxY protein
MSHDKSNHEGHEGHEGRFRMRLASPLSPEAETAMWQVIGSAIEVHRALGPGYLESIYKRAMCIALAKAGMSYEYEKAVEVMYEGVAIPGQRVDLIVEKLIVVELKAVRRFEEIHEAQVVSYLKTTGLRGGLLINFHVPVLSRGIKRIVL